MKRSRPEPAGGALGDVVVLYVLPADVPVPLESAPMRLPDSLHAEFRAALSVESFCFCMVSLPTREHFIPCFSHDFAKTEATQDQKRPASRFWAIPCTHKMGDIQSESTREEDNAVYGFSYFVDK